MMSSKHYQALAEALGAAEDLDDAITKVIQVLDADNPRFNADRFFAAVDSASKARSA